MPGTLPPDVAAAVNGVAFVGTLLEQLCFGWLWDKMGRKKGLWCDTLIIMIFCSITSGLSFRHTPEAVMGGLFVSFGMSILGPVYGI